MKVFFLLVGLFLGISALAQNPVLPKGLPIVKNGSYSEIGYSRSDSGVLLGFRDTMWRPISGVGAIMVWNNVYWKWDLDSLKWGRLGAGGFNINDYLKKSDSTLYVTISKERSDSALLRGLINAKLNISDTALMLSGYVRISRFLDSLSAIRNTLASSLDTTSRPLGLMNAGRVQQQADSISKKVANDSIPGLQRVLLKDSSGQKGMAITMPYPGPAITMNSSTDAAFSSYKRSGGQPNIGGVVVDVGMLGNPEANLSYNMRYINSFHSLYDQSKGAQWLALHGLGGAFQYCAPYSGPLDCWQASGYPYAMYWKLSPSLTPGASFSQLAINVASGYDAGDNTTMINRIPSKASLSGVSDLVLNGHRNYNTAGVVYTNAGNTGDTWLSFGVPGGGAGKTRTGGDLQIGGNVTSKIRIKDSSLIIYDTITTSAQHEKFAMYAGQPGSGAAAGFTMNIDRTTTVGDMVTAVASSPGVYPIRNRQAFNGTQTQYGNIVSTDTVKSPVYTGSKFNLTTSWRVIKDGSASALESGAWVNAAENRGWGFQLTDGANPGFALYGTNGSNTFNKAFQVEPSGVINSAGNFAANYNARSYVDKNYVDSSTGIGGGYVTINTAQNITSVKTLSPTVSFSSGTQNYAPLIVSPNVTFTGTATGNPAGIRVQPTLSGVTGFRGLETIVNFGEGHQIYQSGTGRNYFRGSTAVDSTWTFNTTVFGAISRWSAVTTNSYAPTSGTSGIGFQLPTQTSTLMNNGLLKIFNFGNINVGDNNHNGVYITDSLTQTANLTGGKSWNTVVVNPSMIQTGFTGTTRTMYITPSLTNATDHRALQIDGVSAANGYSILTTGTGAVSFGGVIQNPGIQAAITATDTAVLMSNRSAGASQGTQTYLNKQLFINWLGALTYANLDTLGANGGALSRVDRMRNTIRDSLLYSGKVISVSTSVTLPSDALTVFAGNNLSTTTLTLPSAASLPNKRYIIKNTVTGQNVTIAPTGGDFVEVTTLAPRGYVTLVSNGSSWLQVSGASNVQYGSSTQTATAGTTSYSIAHGVSGVTSSSRVFVTARTADAGGFRYVDVDGTSITIYYTVSPTTGTSLKWDWEIKP